MMTPELEQEYVKFVTNLGLQRGSVSDPSTNPRTNEMSFDLLHMTLGMVTESAEIADLLKKHMAYDRPLDKQKLKDELGDLQFYLIGALVDLGSSLEEIIRMNIAKLKTRYPDGYNHKSANNRNKEAENAAQEKVVNVDGEVVLKGSEKDDRTW